jgi:hypothetical protein
MAAATGRSVLLKTKSPEGEQRLEVDTGNFLLCCRRRMYFGKLTGS